MKVFKLFVYLLASEIVNNIYSQDFYALGISVIIILKYEINYLHLLFKIANRYYEMQPGRRKKTGLLPRSAMVA